MLDPLDLQALSELTPPELLRRGPGRETFRWQGPAGRGYVVKRFTRSRRAELLGRHPAREEFENLRRLRAEGLAVPQPVELFEGPRTALVVMDELAHSTDLRRRLTRRPHEARRWLPEVLDLTLALHSRGWYHRDLYLDHFVLAQGPDGESLALLDLGRARCQATPRRRWFVKDLAALLLSTPRAVSDLTRLRFLAGYLDGRGIGERAQRRWWCQAVLRKARRMAAHRPRGGTSFDCGAEVVG